MLYREITAVCSQIHTKHKYNILRKMRGTSSVEATYAVYQRFPNCAQRPLPSVSVDKFL